MTIPGLLGVSLVLAAVSGWCATALWFQAPGAARVPAPQADERQQAQ